MKCITISSCTETIKQFSSSNDNIIAINLLPYETLHLLKRTGIDHASFFSASTVTYSIKESIHFTMKMCMPDKPIISDLFLQSSKNIKAEPA